MRLREAGAAGGWFAAAGLLAVLAGGLPALALAAPPADPTVTVVRTGAGGLVLLRDSDGRLIVLGGSETRTAASASLDRLLPPWERRLALLLVPPPHAEHLPGALDLLDRRPVGRASLVGLSRRPHPALDAWQARQREAPVIGQAAIALGGDTWLRLDSGDDPAGEAALALVERGPVRLLLLLGDAAPLAEARLAHGRLSPPTVAVRLTARVRPLPLALQPPLSIAVEGTTTPGPPRLIALAPGEALQIVLRPDRLLVQGDVVAASRPHQSDDHIPRVAPQRV